MAFTCTAYRPTLYNEPIQNHEDRWFAIVEIGIDADDPAGPFTYYSVIHTYPIQGSIEFAFMVLQVNNITGEQSHTYESKVVASMVPKSCRVFMLNIVKFYAEKLIESSVPETFFMETFTPFLDPPALAKYEPLCHIFSRVGYDVKKVDTSLGKHKWMMNRSS